MNTKKVTMEHIAKEAGVSKFAVSKALNNKSGVSEKTRKKIQETAEKLNYRHASSSSNTKKNKSVQDGFILCVIPNTHYQQEPYYWARVMEGITNACEKAGLGLFIITETQSLEKAFHKEAVKGVISIGEVSFSRLKELEKLRVPMVLLDHDEPSLQADCILKDNVEGIRQLTAHLLQVGHHYIAFAGDLSHSESFHERWRGYRLAFEEQNRRIPSKQLFFAYNKSFPEEIRALLKKIPLKAFPTAIVCANDDIALRMMTLLHEFEVKIPEDCAITGFDDLDYNQLSVPALTTVQVLKEAMGERAVSRILCRLLHREAPKEKILIRGEILLRGSTTNMEKSI